MTTTMTLVPPVRGVEYDKNRPETRGPWLEQRRGGITATEIRDWGNGAKRREIITNKVTGNFEDLSTLPYVNHGNLREPVIAAWIDDNFGIKPCDYVYSHGANPRLLASPDGVTLDPFTGELVIGPNAVLSEIKTSKHDLTPGTLDGDRVLIEIEVGSKFDLSNYYLQMQWQMFVMQAGMTLFVWEQHNDIVDPATGTFTPKGVPQYAWIPRNEAVIERLAYDRAPRALADIDAARGAQGLPPIADVPAEHAILVTDLLDARDAEAIQVKKKKAAWDALSAKYLSDDAPDVDKLDAGDGVITVSTSGGNPKEETYIDYEAMERRAPAAVAKYRELEKKYTKTRTVETPTTRKMTITRKKA